MARTMLSLKNTLGKIAEACLDLLRAELDELQNTIDELKGVVDRHPDVADYSATAGYVAVVEKLARRANDIRAKCIAACEEASQSWTNRMDEEASEKWLDSEEGEAFAAFGAELEEAVQNVWEEMSVVEASRYSPGADVIRIANGDEIEVETIGDTELGEMQDAWTALDELCDSIEEGPQG